jgi:GH15 family glucan-1,4-alpha-glucosidase
MCWAACDRLAKIAHALAAHNERAELWASRAGIIRARIVEQAWSVKRQSFVESFGGSELDAILLLMAEVGFLPTGDPRFKSTVLALEAALCDGPYMRRYEAADDFGRPESSFNVCSFWRVDALVRIGQHERARELFEALLARRNHVGLLSEDTSPVTGELWGNFPQTYSMVGIINGAVRLSAHWEDIV